VTEVTDYRARENIRAIDTIGRKAGAYGELSIVRRHNDHSAARVICTGRCTNARLENDCVGPITRHHIKYLANESTAVPSN
jgi:hypothetical protein